MNERSDEPTRLFDFDNTYARDLDGFSAPWQPSDVANPCLIRFNEDLAVSLGLDPQLLAGPAGASVFAGASLPDGATPIAQAYAGHQFGGFSPQLGDGRAVVLGEIVDPAGARHDIALKGSGRTPFSRGGDGKAALGPVLREYLMGEAMHALGVPTTRALAVVTTGERVIRDRPLPGAVLTRVAASHLRVGTFQFFASRGDVDKVRRLVAYAIGRHDPDLVEDPNPALALLDSVIDRQAELIAAWMNIGFIHGVMNTDNVTISGETIDFGPCALLETFDPSAVFSSIDEGGRYAYGNQPAIGKWNMARFAESLLPAIADDVDQAVESATQALDRFDDRYRDHWMTGVRRKLGLNTSSDDDLALAEDWLGLLAQQRVDFTLAWRRLADAADGDEAPLGVLFDDRHPLDEWLTRWRERSSSEPGDQAGRAGAMRQVNPMYIPRNHLVEEALTAAVDHDDLGPFDRLLATVTRPFDERAGDERYGQPAAPNFTAAYRTFCGT
jgi:uncharacterized protein YdiU (UPF0061 family)